MRIIGIKCSKDQLQWAIVDGLVRADATIIDSAESRAPAGFRGEQLEWARKEVAEILVRYSPDCGRLRVAEAGPNISATLGRAEMDGVVQEILSANAVPVSRCYGASIRSAFAVKNKADLELAVIQIACIASTPKTRRESVITATTALPSE